MKISGIGYKTPGERKSFGLDWTAALNGDPISPAPGSSTWTITPSDATVVSSAVNAAGTATTFVTQGGTFDVIYTAENTVVTIGGQTLTQAFRFYVHDHNFVVEDPNTQEFESVDTPAAPDVSATMLLACSPSGRRVTANGSGQQMGTYDFNFVVNATAADTISLPAGPIAFRDYTILDGGGNFASNPQTIQPLGFIMNINGDSLTVFSDDTGTWRVK